MQRVGAPEWIGPPSGLLDRRLSGPPFVDSRYILVRPAEVMGEFVDGHMGHKLGQGDISPFRPFIEDRAPEQPDDIGALRLVKDGFLGQRNTLVKTCQIKRLHLHFPQGVLIREVCDAQCDSACGVPECRRQMRHRLAGMFLDLVKGWGGVVQGA